MTHITDPNTIETRPTGRANTKSATITMPSLGGSAKAGTELTIRANTTRNAIVFFLMDTPPSGHFLPGSE
jgi:hypothetical protein